MRSCTEVRANMDTEALQLWKQRKQAFTKEVIPYIRYMLQSGFPAFLSLVFILSSIQYFTFIRNIPPNFPIELVAALLFTPFVAYSPLRTWLKEADTIFLMPMEHRLSGYFKQSHIRSLRNSLSYLAIVVVIFWPIYRHAERYSPVITIVLLLALKLGNHLLAWKERKMPWASTRNSLRILRWVITWMLIIGWLVAPAYIGTIAVTFIVIIMVALLYKLHANAAFPWQRLIVEEKDTIRRIYAFFSWFIDVKTSGPMIKQRNYLNGLIKVVPYGKQYVFVFLNMITFVRTEAGGICIRLLLLGGLVGYIAADTNGLSGWGPMISTIIFGFMLCLQIGALRKIHQYAIWKHIFPMQAKLQHEQIIVVDRVLCYVLLVLLFIPTFPVWDKAHAAQLAIMALFVAGYPLLRGMSVRRKLIKEAEDDLD